MCKERRKNKKKKRNTRTSILSLTMLQLIKTFYYITNIVKCYIKFQWKTKVKEVLFFVQFSFFVVVVECCRINKTLHGKKKKKKIITKRPHLNHQMYILLRNIGSLTNLLLFSHNKKKPPLPNRDSHLNRISRSELISLTKKKPTIFP